MQLQAGIFRLQTYAPQKRSAELSIYLEAELSIYLEGDGFAWFNSRQPPPDPTPLDPMALRLAQAQPSGNATYLGRPCQQRYWPHQRFGEDATSPCLQ